MLDPARLLLVCALALPHFALAGAMAELGRKPQESRFIESWLCNSDKVFAVFRP